MLDLPCLRSLSLKLFREVDTAQAMEFFDRHPSIEYLNITDNFLSDPSDRWFASELPQNFLPNLVHLRVSWKKKKNSRLTRIVLSMTFFS
jgi:hypothetical protein